VDEYGAIPNDNSNDNFGIQSAIDAAILAGGGIVKFSAGTYRLGKQDANAVVFPIQVRSSNVILQGAGSGGAGTILYQVDALQTYGDWSGAMMVQFVEPSIKGKEHNYGKYETNPATTDWWSTSGTWSESNQFMIENTPEFLSVGVSDALRQTKTVQVQNPEKFHPDQLVIITMMDSLYLTEFIQPWDLNQISKDNFPPVRRARQILTVENVSGNTITFKERFRLNYQTKFGIVLAQYSCIANVAVQGFTFQSSTFNNQYGNICPTAGALMFTNVYNGWVKDCRFLNVHDAVALSQCKNVTVEDCEYANNLTGTKEYTFNGFHNSFKFLGTTNDCLMQRLKYSAKANWGPCIQAHASGNVFLDVELWRTSKDNGNVDTHAGTPFSNLYDRIKYGQMGATGGGAGLINSGPFNTWWNWSAENLEAPTKDEEFPVWKGYIDYVPRHIQPIVVGYNSTNTTESVQFVTASDPSPVYKPEVTVESLGTSVNPSSLYLAQMNSRFGEVQNGIYAFIDGENQLKLNESYSWDASKSIGSNLSFQWLVDNQSVATGTNFQYTFNNAGHHTITLIATQSIGVSQATTRDVWVADLNGVVFETFSSPKPASQWIFNTGRLWSVKPIFTPNASFRSVPDISGTVFGIHNAHQNANAGKLGGYVFSELPKSGISLSNLLCSYTISNDVAAGVLRFIARDSNGKWAMSTANIAYGVQNVNLSTVTWVTPAAELNLANGAFNASKITAFGVCALYTGSWQMTKYVLKLNNFSLTSKLATGGNHTIDTQSNTLLVYPNPVNDQLNIRINNEITQTIGIQITNILGQVVENKQNCEVNNKSINCSVGHLEKGIYTISVWSNSKLIGVSKFVKVNF
jgi:hypothetical protein